MQFLIYFLISLLSSTIGSISGIGGGVIIKPVMDAFGQFPLSTIGFLSGCTVLSMSIFSLLRNIKSDIKIELNVTLYLAIGSCFGGYIGKNMFSSLSIIFDNISLLGIIQTSILLLINIIVLIYIIYKSKIKTYQVKNKILCIMIGIFLGIISSFLGIGGGPLNIAVLYFMFSMSPKSTVLNSIFIIFSSQLISLITTLSSQTVPNDVNYILLSLMCFGGILGAFIGTHLSKKMSDKIIKQLFQVVLILLIFINIFNLLQYTNII